MVAAVVAALLLLSVTAAAQTPVPAETLNAARVVYMRARQELQLGHRQQALALAATITGYPLYPYLEYDDLRRRLAQLPDTDVARFLAHHDDTLLAARLRQEWLRELAVRKLWTLYRRDYRKTADLTARCHAATAEYAGGNADAALEATVELWMLGVPMPAACDPAFARLATSTRYDDTLIWDRLRLAFAHGHSGLAAYLARQLRAADTRALASSWVRAAQNPAGELDTLASSGPRGQEALVYALERLARLNVDAARAAWNRLIRRSVSFSAADAGHIAATLAIQAADADHADSIALLDAVPAAAVDSSVERYRLRVAIARGDWAALLRWTEQPPHAEEDTLRWKYWQARSLLHHGREEAGQGMLHELARERDYYGFIAADAVGGTYAFQSRSIAVTPDETAQLLRHPGLVRAHELGLVNQRADARSEWAFETARFDHRQLEVAAVIATAWSWHDSAIAALGQARSYDDLILRFPVLHTEVVVAQARKYALDPARVMAIIRSESAFAREARSVAGALGLMQLLPGTARETAQRIGLPFSGNAQLFQPRTNIALGAAYLSQVQQGFGGSFVMAAAAYNAGPGRVRQWQGSTCISAEKWIELIPFAETKAYVRRALFYAAIYQWRLDRPLTRLEAMMDAIPARDVSETTSCKL